ncbi:MAG: hypothetical protein U0R64_08490 [Candidatus Nanopelagicales bacterium]
MGAAGRRSGALTKKRRWRSLAIIFGIMAVASLPGPLLGSILLLATGLSFSMVNVVVLVVTAITSCAAAVSMALLYFDLRHRASAEGATA